MSITPEAIDKIVALAEPTITKHHDAEYSSKGLHRIEKPLATPVSAHSLQALIDYVTGNPDKLAEVLVGVESRAVAVMSPLNEDKNRETYFTAGPHIQDSHYGRYMDVEDFRIWLMTGFADTEERKKVIEFISSLSDKDENELKDDGVAQSVTVKTGVASLGLADVPNPVTLSPYRTFTDIEQPSSPFVFRMQKGLSCALYEADGGAWRREEVAAVKAHLEAALKDSINVKITLLG